MKLLNLTILFVLSLSGCASMNEDFSCKKTATDSCLNIDEVNAMTEPKETFKKTAVFHQVENNTTNHETIWFAENNSEVR